MSAPLPHRTKGCAGKRLPRDQNGRGAHQRCGRTWIVRQTQQVTYLENEDAARDIQMMLEGLMARDVQ